ncbi:MAG: hypothetical protein KBT06_04445 [Prevotellaceae bacterium]|nr:hypothetical protein [Candidatus Colivivens equi]
MLEWNVLNPEGFGWKEGKYCYNIFTQDVFVGVYLASALKSRRTLSKACKDKIRGALYNQFGDRSGYEFSLTSPHVQNKDYYLYMDVYTQVMMNFDKFCEYVWEHRKEILKTKRPYPYCKY